MLPSDRIEQRVVYTLLGLILAGTIFSLGFYLAHQASSAYIVFALSGLPLVLGSLIAYRRGHRWGRYTPIIATLVMVGLLMPEPFASQDYSMAVFAPAVFALIVANARWVLGASAVTFGLLIARGGLDSVYLEPIGAVIGSIIIGGMALARQITDAARSRAEEQARLLEAERRLLEQRVEERTRALAEANAELREAGKLKDLFLAGVSHELRTPLNIVLGNVELLREAVYGPLAERQDQALATVQESGRHLLQLINDLLDMARLQAGAFSINRDAVVVAELCEQCARLIQADVERKAIAFRLELDPSAALIDGDAQRLRQILLNLLSNALKFTPAGGRIALSACAIDHGQQIEIAVSDSGIGIAADQLDKLFRPFSQVDRRLARAYGGTGLGLALVAQLTEIHGGSVGVTSTLGQGSRFWVRLPTGRSGEQRA